MEDQRSACILECERYLQHHRVPYQPKMYEFMYCEYYTPEIIMDHLYYATRNGHMGFIIHEVYDKYTSSEFSEVVRKWNDFLIRTFPKPENRCGQSTIGTWFAHKRFGIRIQPIINPIEHDGCSWYENGQKWISYNYPNYCPFCFSVRPHLYRECEQKVKATVSNVVGSDVATLIFQYCHF